MSTELIARCQRLGWALQPHRDGWELRGNGADALFSSDASLAAWLDRQEKGKSQRSLHLNEIVTGDARELAKAIPDESVDFIFTDPEYANTDDYLWLSETAARILKPNRSMLAFYGGPKPRETMERLETHMRYRWTLNYYVPGKASKLRGYNMFVHNTPCYWMVKGNGVPHSCIIDTLRLATHRDGLDNSLNFEWNKHPSFIAYYLQAFTKPGDIVYDPFMGGGTTAVVCRMFRRDFIGSERDIERAAGARARVATTQIIDPVFLEEQNVMLESELV